MNDYFTAPANLIPTQTARSGDVNDRMAALVTAFDKLPGPLKLQQGRATFCQDSGAVNALVATLDFAPLSYVAGLELTVLVANTNTAAATLNVNGLGAAPIRRANGDATEAGDLTAGQIIKLVYGVGEFRLLSSSESAAASSATAAAASAALALGYKNDAAASATTASGHATTATNKAAEAAASAAAAAASAASIDVSNKADKNNAVFTGTNPVLPNATPTAALQAATKQYVDDSVIASGGYTADGTSITLSGGQFSLTTIASNRILGNVTLGAAKPVALTGSQVAGILPAATTGSPGLMDATDKTKANAITMVGADARVTYADILFNSRTIAISGAVTGTATAFNGGANITIPITALDVGSATAGTLAVARGGTGVTTSTGTGSVALSDSPALTGTPTAPTAATATNTTQLATTAYVKANLASYAPTASPAFTGQITSASGTAGAPAISFTGDPDTGIYRISADALGFAAGGALRLQVNSGGAFAVGVLNGSTYAVASLPAASSLAGARAFVTDANATTFGSIVAGGGANGVPVYSDGSAWRIG